jgi:hypothetical protein
MKKPVGLNPATIQNFSVFVNRKWLNNKIVIPVHPNSCKTVLSLRLNNPRTDAKNREKRAPTAGKGLHNLETATGY